MSIPNNLDNEWGNKHAQGQMLKLISAECLCFVTLVLIDKLLCLNANALAYFVRMWMLYYIDIKLGISVSKNNAPAYFCRMSKSYNLDGECVQKQTL